MLITVYSTSSLIKFRQIFKYFSQTYLDTFWETDFPVICFLTSFEFKAVPANGNTKIEMVMHF